MNPKALTVCTPPTVPVCVITGPENPDLPGGNITCTCPPPPPIERLCTVSLVYVQSKPNEPTLAAYDCPGASVEIALAVLLAKLLTSPPLP